MSTTVSVTPYAYVVETCMELKKNISHRQHAAVSL